MKKTDASNSIEKKTYDQNGAALVISIFAILLLTIIGVAIIRTGLTSLDISQNSREQTEAFYISEAGLTHATQILLATNPSEFTAILQAGDGVAGTGDELSTRPSNLTPIPLAGLTFGNGRYVVKVSDDSADTDGNPNADSNGRLVIASIGYGQNGATATTEAIIGNSDTGRIGILADGDIISSNNVFVRGPGGTIHSNNSFQTSSNVCVDNFISQTSSSAMNLSKITSGPTCSTSASVGLNVFYSKPNLTPEIYDIPVLQNIFRPQADYIFSDDGNIYPKGIAIALTSAERTAAGFDGWTWNAGANLWSYSSGTPIANWIYYMENSNIKISNGGDDTVPPRITLITEGSIEITNGPSFQPNLPGFALIAANDIKISSKSGVSGNPGLIYAYGQMEITNQSTIYGWLQAANFRKSDGTNGLDVTDPGGNNLVSVSSKGTLRLSNVTTVNTPAGSGTGSGLTILSWREIRN